MGQQLGLATPLTCEDPQPVWNDHGLLSGWDI